MKVKFAPAAVDDLIALEEYIGETSEEAAQRVGDSLYECCVGLGESPEMGRAREDLAPGLRYLPHTGSSYLIFYRIQNEVVEIVRILHGSMDYPRLFE